MLIDSKIILLLMKVSERDRNVKGIRMLVVLREQYFL